MYASLIGAGISQLYDLYKSATESSASTSAASKTSFNPSTDDDAASATGATKATGAVNSPSRSGGSLSDTVQKLLADLQSSTSTSGTAAADATSTIGGDLKSLSHKLGLGHGRHGGTAADGGNANPVGGVANSLLAYAKTQSLTASGSASLTA